MKQSRLSAFATFVFALAAASTSAAAIADHQQYYKIKDDVAKAAYNADLVPTDTAFPLAQGCEIKVPARLLCIDVDKTNVTPAPPGSGAGLPAQKSLCYKVKCPKPAAPIETTIVDQFGTHGVRATQTSYVCAPVPAPVTTTTLPPGGCNTVADCDPVANGHAICSASTCVIDSCDAGYANCDMNYSTGCETDIDTSMMNCGGCSQECAPDHATGQCSGGTCMLSFCDPGYGDCDLDISNGCEVNTSSDVQNCGTCNAVCSVPNATPTCLAGGCAVDSCNVGYSDCDSQAGNGCEVNTNSDPVNCGVCNNLCPPFAPNCVFGSCTP